MISAIKNIGKLILANKILNEYSLEGKVISVILDTSDKDKLSFSIDIEDFDSTKSNLYLYKKLFCTGNIALPFLPITDVPKNLTKIERWLKSVLKQKSIKDNDLKLVHTILDSLLSFKDGIILALNREIQEITQKTTKFLTLKIKTDAEKIRYLGEFDIFKNYMSVPKKANTGSAICSVCGEFSNALSDKLDVFKFYTTDKPGFISGGFSKEDTWRNFPVCPSCKLYLNEGKEFLEKNLKFKFYGFQYLIVPKLLSNDLHILEEVISILVNSVKNIKLNKDTENRVISDEEEIFHYITELHDSISLNLLFLEKNQSAEIIKLLIEDLLPSRFTRIMEVKQEVEKMFDSLYSFKQIRTFFEKSEKKRKKRDLDKYFLEIINSIFNSTPIDKTLLFKYFMLVICREFRRNGYFKSKTLDALKNLYFFECLNLITYCKEAFMPSNIFDPVFNCTKALNTPEKRGIFLLGALTQTLLNKQFTKLGSTPFFKKLKNLKMNEKNFKELLPSIRSKLEEYNSFDKGKKQIAIEISKFLLETDDKWNTPIAEMNFYFTCGMSLYEKVTAIVYPNKDDTDAEDTDAEDTDAEDTDAIISKGIYSLPI